MSGHVILVLCLALTGLALGWVQRQVIARFVTGSSPSALVAGAVTAMLFLMLEAREHDGFVLAALCALTVVAVPLAFIDAAEQRLPNPLTAAAYAVILAGLLLAAAVGNHWPDLARAALGGLALAGFYLVLAVISPSGMGAGDVKLAASMGTALAWVSWRALVLGGFAGFGLLALYSTAMMTVGRLGRKQYVPVGPFMIAGAFLLLLATPA
ncbi:MAG TPA: A24 family peptidase [Streptosporangiaceae bacterium]